MLETEVVMHDKNEETKKRHTARNSEHGELVKRTLAIIREAEINQFDIIY